MTSAIELKSPDGTNKVRLEHPDNVSKTINIVNLKEEADIQTMIKNRAGSAGAFSFRNKIIDGRFDFWYEGTSQLTNGYGSSTMWQSTNTAGGSTKVYSQQSLTNGVDLPNIDVPTALYYSRTVVTSVVNAGSFITLQQQIENVKTLAGKTAMLSFYARSDAARNIAVELYQHIDSTATNDISIPGGLVNLTTSWKKYTVPFTIPSLTGKTINAAPDYLRLLFWFDAGSSLSSRASGLGQQSGTFDIACVQLEEGSVATPFEELPIEISQTRVFRYYRPVYLSGSGYFAGVDWIRGNTFGGVVGYQVMRTTPTISGSFTENYNIQTIGVFEGRYLAQTAAPGTAYFQWHGNADARL